ncbi:glycosyltransferase [Pontibacter vulgaris]|uniref:glycosyltransferase n=1 Tax=Pontibacter vulgaris TaxID=2905679 RepID=UPI001FA802F0|nr:glycosyltransferase [Pontibacter vulgaris]
MTALLILSLAAYSWIILRRWVAWVNLPVATVPSIYQPTTPLSVIIPVRNEQANILYLLQDLEQQNYPSALVEILIIDDHSDDNTAALVEEFIGKTRLKIQLIKLQDYKGITGKKAAVKLGVALAQKELLVFTDGDCHVQPDWLLQLAHLYETQQPYFISGPVAFQNTESAFQRMQLVEFASLIGIGGASIGLGKPNMCNGANLAYTKHIFVEVGGFAGNEGIASGDDEFLLHKINKKHPGKVAFLKSTKAVVYTNACKSVNSFIEQRVRWASKWRAYQELHVQVVAFVVFAVNLLLFIAIPAVVWGSLPVPVFIAAYLTKFAVDLVFLTRILRFLDSGRYSWYILPLQLVYAPYVIYTAICGLFGRYTWKGRQISNQ